MNMPGLSQTSEKLLIRAPIGIKFWDHGSNRPVTDDLSVKAWPEKGPFRPVSAIKNSAGIYSFHNLPGLIEWEYPDNDEGIPQSPPISKKFIIKVEDKRNRFLDTAVSVDLPCPGNRIYLNYKQSPAIENKGLRLFSAPTRPVEPHLAVVRAFLWDRIQNKAASYAVLKIDVSGTTWCGIANHRGSLSLMFPYPMTMQNIDTSPPSTRIPAHEQSWPVTVRAFYEGTDMTALPYAETPDLHHILKQKQVMICETDLELKDKLNKTLMIGRELVIKTKQSDDSKQDKLLIQPVISSP